MKHETYRYINPLTDFGFKKLFGEEANKEFLLSFLNALLEEEQGKIVELQYQNTEQLGIAANERSSIFDLYCTNEASEHFIVELQRASQKYFIDRTIFYSSFLIQKQGKRDKNWNYELKAVYTIAIINFKMDKSLQNKDKYLYRVKLTDIETHEILYPKLAFIYLELPKFKKKAVELQTPIDKWLYVFRNLETLQEIPEKLKENIFMKFIEQSLIEHLPKIDRKNYQASLKRYRDSYSVLETAVSKGFEKGKVEGIAERNIAVVIAAHNKGFSISIISELTGLTEDEITKILEENL